MGDIYTNPPQSRNEAILRATIDGTEYEAPPQSRIEDLLVELKAAIEQGACTGSYNDLSNKPQINSVTLQGDQSISDLFDGKVDIGVGTVEESGYAELKDENGDRIFRASSANGGASVESGALIGQPGALVLYNGEGGLSSVRPKGGVSLVEVDLPAENGTLALDSQIASSQTPPKSSVVTVNDAAPINAEDITVDIAPVQDLHGYDRPWAGGAGKNKMPAGEAQDVTFNGIRFQSDGKGTYHVSGTKTTENTQNAYFMLEVPFTIPYSTDCTVYFMNTTANNDVVFYFYNGSTPVDLWGLSPENKYSGSYSAMGGKYCDRVMIQVRTNDPVDITLSPMFLLKAETDLTFAPYSNICPIEGWTGAELDRVGKNLWKDGNVTATTYNTVVYTPPRTGDYTLSAIATTNSDNKNCLVRFCKDSAGMVQIGQAFILADGARHEETATLPLEKDVTIYVFFYASNGYAASVGKTATYSDIQLEVSADATSYEPYQGQQYTASFGETVYGGKWHVTAGGTDNTHANIASYNGETINEPWLSSMDEYSPGATPTTGAQVVYPLTTPTTISTPKQNVPMLKGINTISADCGDTQLKYQPDNVIGELKGMIQALDARVTALEEAE